MAFPIDAIKIDFDEDIEYGQDQAYVNFPIVFPTVSFMLQPTDVEAVQKACYNSLNSFSRGDFVCISTA